MNFRYSELKVGIFIFYILIVEPTVHRTTNPFTAIDDNILPDSNNSNGTEHSHSLNLNFNFLVQQQNTNSNLCVHNVNNTTHHIHPHHQDTSNHSPQHNVMMSSPTRGQMASPPHGMMTSSPPLHHHMTSPMSSPPTSPPTMNGGHAMSPNIPPVSTFIKSCDAMLHPPSPTGSMTSSASSPYHVQPTTPSSGYMHSNGTTYSRSRQCSESDSYVSYEHQQHSNGLANITTMGQMQPGSNKLTEMYNSNSIPRSRSSSLTSNGDCRLSQCSPPNSNFIHVSTVSPNLQPATTSYSDLTSPSRQFSPAFQHQQEHPCVKSESDLSTCITRMRSTGSIMPSNHYDTNSNYIRRCSLDSGLLHISNNSNNNNNIYTSTDTPMPNGVYLKQEPESLMENYSSATGMSNFIPVYPQEDETCNAHPFFPPQQVTFQPIVGSNGNDGSFILSQEFSSAMPHDPRNTHRISNHGPMHHQRHSGDHRPPPPYPMAVNGTIPYRPRYSRRNNPDLEKKRVHKCVYLGKHFLFYIRWEK